MTTRFHLVRHGPTHAQCMVGWSDIPADLSDYVQLKHLSSALPQDALVISSDLMRATKTADAIVNTRTRLPHNSDLREMNFGTWEMRRWAEIDAETPDLIRSFWETPGDVAPPQGESWNMLCARVNRQMDHLAHTHINTDIIVVGHFGQILCQIQRAGGFTPTQAFSHKINNLSVSQITHDQGTWSLCSINQNY